MCLVLSVAFVPDAVVCKTDPGRSDGLEPSRSGVQILGSALFQAADRRS